MRNTGEHQKGAFFTGTTDDMLLFMEQSWV